MFKKCLLAWCLLLGGIAVTSAQEQNKTATVRRGQTVALEAPKGYNAYRWQVSTDGGKTFIDLPAGNTRTTEVKVYVPATYRAAIVGSDGETKYIAQTTIDTENIRFAGKASEAPAGHGYVETADGKPGGTGISIPGCDRGADGLPTFGARLTRWTDPAALAVFYFHHPLGTVDTKMVFTAARGAKMAFRLRIIDPQNPARPLAETYLTEQGTGRADTISIVGFNVPATGYYRYELKCLAGNSSLTNIDRFIFASTTGVQSYVANYLSSPSVHLNNWRSTQNGAPSGAAYDWCYQEVMMPPESDIVGTYVMSLGVLRGYMGIQMNGYDAAGLSKHEVLFSMWDDGSTDEDPNLPEYLRAGAVDWGKDVAVNRFGNEGTGIQTYRHGHLWEAGTFVQFLTNSRIEDTQYTVVENGHKVVKKQTNTLVSAWFNAQDGKGWQYLATTRLPNGRKLFDSWYSFLENYNWPTGQASRKGYYRNGYGRAAATGKWYHFNAVGFGHTDGGSKTGARNDWGQGTTTDYPRTFFMQTGGYTPTNMTGSTVDLNPNNTPVDTIDLQTLTARVDEAIAREKERNEKASIFNSDNLYDKKDWKVISFSSQETNGEGSNGRATQIIDGDVKTYWHSQWQGTQAKYPHIFVIDTQKEISVAGFRFTMSGGSNRYIKAFDLYASTDNNVWTKIYTTDEAPNDASFNVFLDKAVKLRYFRIVIRSGRANDGPFVRINEIDVAKGKVSTGIASVPMSPVIGTLKVRPSADGTLLSFASPLTAPTLNISVDDLNGRRLHSTVYNDATIGTTIAVPVPRGTLACIVTVESAGYVYAGKAILDKR